MIVGCEGRCWRGQLRDRVGGILRDNAVQLGRALGERRHGEWRRQDARWVRVGELAGAEHAQHIVRATELCHERMKVLRQPAHAYAQRATACGLERGDRLAP